MVDSDLELRTSPRRWPRGGGEIGGEEGIAASFSWKVAAAAELRRVENKDGNFTMGTGIPYPYKEGMSTFLYS